MYFIIPIPEVSWGSSYIVSLGLWSFETVYPELLIFLWTLLMGILWWQNRNCSTSERNRNFFFFCKVHVCIMTPNCYKLDFLLKNFQTTSKMRNPLWQQWWSGYYNSFSRKNILFLSYVYPVWGRQLSLTFI